MFSNDPRFGGTELSLYLRQGPAFQDLLRYDPLHDTSYLKPVIGFHNNSAVEVLEKHID